MGGVSHQSPGYGLVGSGTYEFTPGSYSITLQHYGTNLDSPDYDYTASVEKVSGGARVTVEDPQGTVYNHRQLNTDVLHTHQHQRPQIPTRHFTKRCIYLRNVTTAFRNVGISQQRRQHSLCSG